jgi:Fe-Mn family superoxide dismutase
MAFELPELGYAYDALEPNIDAKTMEIHHSKHHNGYTTKLNAAIAGTDLEGKTIEEILTGLDMDHHVDWAVRNNGGGFYNHSLFWSILNPEDKGYLTGAFRDAVEEAFGDVDNFKDEFAKAAATQFGSGWAFVVAFPDGHIGITATPNQDNPLMPDVGNGGTPILALDVWEHAYYLNYQNRRPDYIEAFMKCVNWNEVERRYDAVAIHREEIAKVKADAKGEKES